MTRRYHRHRLRRYLEMRDDRRRLDSAMASACLPEPLRWVLRAVLYHAGLSAALDTLETVLGVRDDPAAEARWCERAGRLRREGVGR